MKAQGLPINFIVIAALAILILILAAGFVIAGGSAFGGAVAPEQARSTCNGFCNDARREASAIFAPTEIEGWEDGTAVTSVTDTRFCTATFDIQGQEAGATCPKIVGTCLVTFGDGTTFAITESSCS